MANSILLTIDWRDADSGRPEAQQEVLTQSVFQSLRSLDPVQSVRRVADPDVPKGSMGAQWLWNILTAEIPGDGLRVAVQEALSKLEGETITFTVESKEDAQKIEVSSVHPDDFDRVVDKLVDAVEKMKQTS